MSTGPGRKAIIVPLAAVALALMPAGAWAVADVISNSGNSFDKATYFSDEGDLVQFQHGSDEGEYHDVTSTQYSGGEPLFRSATISTGTAPVDGTQFLAPGTYPFICTVHQYEGMAAELVVRDIAGAPPPPPRPDIEVAIRSRNLEKVLSSGRLAVKVQALTDSDDVKLVASLGRRVLAKKTNIDLLAGQVLKLALKLGSRDRAAFGDRDKAKVKLTGTLPSGFPDVFRRVLR
jgi:plastocyanin